MNQIVEDKLNSFFAGYKRRTYKKGAFLIWPGDDPLEIYYLKSGIVIEYIISKKGNEAILAFYSPKELFPLSLVNGTADDHYFEALFESEAYRAPYEDYMHFVNSNPDILLALFKQSTKELDDIKKRMSHTMAGDAYSRLVQEILLIAHYEGEKDGKTGSIELKNFVEKSAAARTGLTIETVSREMKKLKSKKLVDFRRNVLVIYNIDLLKKEIDDY